MEKLAAVFLVFWFYFASATLKIKDLKVPQAIEYGSSDSVVLDCDFEATNEEGLVIKWFYNDGVTMIYQWIPNKHDPQATHNKFRDKIDTRFKISNDSFTMHRALYIKEIQPNLSGNYTCKVSSDDSEVTDTKEMIIYEPAKYGLQLVSLQASGALSCSAHGLYPKPNMTLYMSTSNETDLVEDEVDLEYSEEDDEYNVTSFLKYDKDSLFEPTEFVCELTIPGTSYHLRKTYTYYPEIFGIEEETTEYPDLYNLTESYVDSNTTESDQDSGNSKFVPNYWLLTVISSLFFIAQRLT